MKAETPIGSGIGVLWLVDFFQIYTRNLLTNFEKGPKMASKIAENCREREGAQVREMRISSQKRSQNAKSDPKMRNQKSDLKMRNLIPK